jgi:uncharacterized RDD family membrane protein YckC
MTTPRIQVDTVTAQARAVHGKPAGIVTRTLANVVDLAITVLVVAGLYLGWAAITFLRRGVDYQAPVVSYRAAYLTGFLVLVGYFTVCWATTGRTYGDRLLGIRVRTRGDLDLSGARSFVRALLCALFPVLLAWVAVSRTQRSVQDLIVGTHVVYDWGGRTSGGSGDAAGVAVHVASPVTHEPHDGEAEALPRLDGEG